MDAVLDFSNKSGNDIALNADTALLQSSANTPFSSHFDQLNSALCSLLSRQLEPSPPGVESVSRLMCNSTQQLQQSQHNPLLLALANFKSANTPVAASTSYLQHLLLNSQRPADLAGSLNELTNIAARLTIPSSLESANNPWSANAIPTSQQSSYSTLAEILAAAPSLHIQQPSAIVSATSPPSSKKVRISTTAESSTFDTKPVKLHASLPQLLSSNVETAIKSRWGQQFHPPLPSSPPPHSTASSSSLSSTQNSPQLGSLARRRSDISVTSTNGSSPLPNYKAKHANGARGLLTPQRKPAAPIPPEKKDASYYERRRKNNDAAKRSRRNKHCQYTIGRRCIAN